MYLKITTSDNLQRITRVLDHSLICIGGNFMWLKGSLNCSYFFNLKIFSKSAYLGAISRGANALGLRCGLWFFWCAAAKAENYWFPQGRLDSSPINTDIVFSWFIQKIYSVNMVYISLSTHLFEVCLGLSVLDNIRELVKSNPGTLLTEKPPGVDSPPCLEICAMYWCSSD